MRSSLRLLLLSLAALSLGACQTEGRRADVAAVAPVAPRGIDGQWNSVGGPIAYNANFNGGRFSSVEANTGAVLAQGTYITLGPGQVSIDYTSKARGQRVAANCNQVEPNRLACASSNGNRFEFTRI
ncbi:hypothetical protein ASG43_02240 [Aureimonas sp. Leaf454]|uniref:hypothetical protein n=1 Tax=Aureimonas sp. Leaf454 TaxID=1736381 RepID=UPI0006F24AC0|nr:hypothetical protein [Aureimonas sp. Leaf454]KQT54441.1 hypothetical protein ASG43_02240 [Aureimonas sp. Leaf454]